MDLLRVLLENSLHIGVVESVWDDENDDGLLLQSPCDGDSFDALSTRRLLQLLEGDINRLFPVESKLRLKI